MTTPIWRIIAVRTAQASSVALALHVLLRWPWTGPHALGLFVTPALCAYFVFVFIAPWTWGLPITTRLRGPEGTVLLTFDDGPTRAVTPRILDTLAAHGATATFFVLGNQVAGCEDLLRRMRGDGHAIGLHGLTHEPLVLPPPRTVRRTLAEAKACVERACPGAQIGWLRPPHGFKTLVLPWIAARVGLRLCAWSVNPHDYQETDAEAIARRVLREVKPGAIVLLHDGEANCATADALPLILDGLARQGYRCVALPPPDGALITEAGGDKDVPT